MANHPLVDVQTKIPSAMIDLPYASDNNFIGQRIDGYHARRCFLSTPAIVALSQVQAALESEGQCIKLWDCYRPQRAVDQFVRWVNSPDDPSKKAIYYPTIEKSSLIKQGYIADQSSHTRGSTVDMTVVDKATGEEWDMGTFFDFFDPKSNTSNTTITQVQQDNRSRLQTLMAKHGFENLPTEWWHFTLKNEPFSTTYFDFVIE
ncbi:MAG: M15 family metallopeptidase [Cellvibrionales bacterium]|nr:M15 family metallopeptidase [Cellvibrionales bacterium]